MRAALSAASARTLMVCALDRASALTGGSARPMHLVAAGKAAFPMAAVAGERFGALLRDGVVVGTTSGAPPRGCEAIVGGHPLPTPESERAGRRALALARSVPASEILLVLLSGGASALLTVPADGISLDEKKAVTARLLAAGANITELNTVRKHLSAIKGGRLAASCPGQVATYALSDVVGDDVSVIASGPTVADTTRYAESLDVLQRFGGEAAFPPGVLDRLKRGAAGEIEETPKADHPRLSRPPIAVIGSRKTAADGAAREAERRGYHVISIDEPVVGEARIAAEEFLGRVSVVAREAPRPFCLVSSGETTVTVRGRGVGGRNQEFALACASALADPSKADRALLASRGYLLASVGTDGVDGPTTAAGALVDSTTSARAASRGVADLERFLDDNNAFAFFHAVGDLIETGPTDTNVGDVQLALVT